MKNTFQYHWVRKISTQELDEAIALIPKCLKGQVLAQKRFYNIFKDSMYQLCLKYSNRNKDVAYDMLQNGFVSVFKHLHRLEKYHLLFSWVSKIFSTTAINYIRSTWTQRLIPENNITVFNENVNNLTTHVGNFDFEYDYEVLIIYSGKYEPLLRLFFKGYSYIEISEAFGISVNTVKSIVSRYRSKVKMDYFQTKS